MELLSTRVQQCENADDTFKTTLRDVLGHGNEIHAGESPSVGSKKKFKEILNYNIIVKSPTQRLLNKVNRNFNLPGAIARFVWMMAANNRLEDIAFYWGIKVAPFTDDGFTVPGSSYGARMFNASPGLDQIEAVIKRLKNDKSTRRAAVSIYHPVDAIRESKDIPCTFGIFYHIRENKLISTIVMRSNNAFILLPYNIFEFSLLAEIIAKEVGVEMGSMYYNAVSMHVYEEHYEHSQKIIDSVEDDRNLPFPDMPFEPSPMQEVKKLIRLESRIRHISAGINNSNIDEWLKDVISLGENEDDKIQLHDYWKQFYYLLLYFIVWQKTVDKVALNKVAQLIKEPFKQYLDFKETNQIPISTQHDLFGNPVHESPDYLAFSQYSRKLKSFESLCKEYNNNPQNDTKIIDINKYMSLRDSLVGDINEMKNIAARGDAPIVSLQNFLLAVNKLFNA